MKVERHSKIVELIGKYEIETQEELAEKLNQSGFNVTQATVSRDIRELKLTKIQGENGRQRYMVLESPRGTSAIKYIRILKDGFMSMDMAQNILVIKTVAGMAMAVAAALDAIHFQEVVGCIAGDGKDQKDGGGLIDMLLELHGKNLALIERADVEFGEGLNILTGETGAGKSIIIGSVSMALGGKASRDSIRHGADYAYIELVFSVKGEDRLRALRELDTEPTEDGLVIISRKITPSRSISRINDETVTAARLRQITGLLLDIHGQHEHQSLLYKSKHLEILDAYA